MPLQASQIRVNGDTGHLERVIVEVRYPRGFRYSSVHGWIVNDILQSDDAWIVTEHQSGGATELARLDVGWTIVFGPLNLAANLSLPASSQSPMGDDLVLEFIEEADRISRLTLDELAVVECSRLGCRMQYVFPQENEGAAARWITELGAGTLPDGFARRLDGEAETHQVVSHVRSSDRLYRVSIEVRSLKAQYDLGDKRLAIDPHRLPVGQREALWDRIRDEQRLRMRPRHAVLLDVDAYREEPRGVAVGEFMRTSLAAVSRMVECEE